MAFTLFGKKLAPIVLLSLLLVGAVTPTVTSSDQANPEDKDGSKPSPFSDEKEEVPCDMKMMTMRIHREVKKLPLREMAVEILTKKIDGDWKQLEKLPLAEKMEMIEQGFKDLEEIKKKKTEL